MKQMICIMKTVFIEKQLIEQTIPNRIREGLWDECIV